MKMFMFLTGKTSYSTHAVILLPTGILMHYTWYGVIFTKADYLIEPVWVRDIELSSYEMAMVCERATTLMGVLPRGYGHWWMKAIFWLFNRNQYLCTNFICDVLGYRVKVGLTPDELYTWLSNVRNVSPTSY
jgi:hypothetical protein